MAGPLSNIRVLDLTRVLAGPWATQMLADFGAEVIKIEKPGEGDDTRGWGPPFLKNPDGSRGDAAYFLSTNRGKTSVCIDMASAEGQKLIHALAAKSDVVIENFKVGGLKKYGLDYDSLKAVNPKLIYCSITGFGQDGPYAQRAGYDFMIQGMAGFMSVTGEPDGPPMKAGWPLPIFSPASMRSLALPLPSSTGNARAKDNISIWRCSTHRWRCWPIRPRIIWWAERCPAGSATRIPISCPTRLLKRRMAISSSRWEPTGSSRSIAPSSACPNLPMTSDSKAIAAGWKIAPP